MDARAQLRADCRAAREAIPATRRREASLAICRRIRTSPAWWSATHIGFYWPMDDEEIDLRELLAAALRDGKRCYLPVMRPGRRLWFVRWRADTELIVNGYGVPEPRWRERDALAPQLLDLVCVPLLGFDRSGTRLGAGGGYYDRSFAFKLARPGGKPRLLGVAYAAQECAAIARAAWDVPLAQIATERELIVCPAVQPRNS